MEQAKLADRINVSRQTVGSLESGRYEPTLRVAMRLSAIFDVPLEDIFTPDPEDIALIRIE